MADSSSSADKTAILFCQTAWDCISLLSSIAQRKPLGTTDASRVSSRVPSESRHSISWTGANAKCVARARLQAQLSVNQIDGDYERVYRDNNYDTACDNFQEDAKR